MEFEQLMKSRGWSGAAMARALTARGVDTSRQYLHNIIKGRRKFPPPMAVAVASILEMDPNEEIVFYCGVFPGAVEWIGYDLSTWRLCLGVTPLLK